MSIVLPTDAKYFGFLDNKIPFNYEWDFTWSFTFALTGNSTDQCGFCTFLTTDTSKLSANPGHYLGYLGFEGYLLTDEGIPIVTDEGKFIAVSENNPNLLGIAFDTTGYFGLSNTTWSGVGQSSIKKNSIIVRNSEQLLYYEALSALSSDFFILSSGPVYQTLRFRVANAGTKLSVDRMKDGVYETLVSLPITMDIYNQNQVIYPAFSFCAPLSSSTSNDVTLFLKNFHVQGNTLPATFE